MSDDPSLRICEWCGEPFRQARTGRKALYCSKTHRHYAWRQRHTQRLINAALESPTGPLPTQPESPVGLSESPVGETASAQVTVPEPTPEPSPEEVRQRAEQVMEERRRLVDRQKGKHRKPDSANWVPRIF